MHPFFCNPQTPFSFGGFPSGCQSSCNFGSQSPQNGWNGNVNPGVPWNGGFNNAGWNNSFNSSPAPFNSNWNANAGAFGPSPFGWDPSSAFGNAVNGPWGSNGFSNWNGFSNPPFFQSNPFFSNNVPFGNTPWNSGPWSQWQGGQFWNNSFAPNVGSFVPNFSQIPFGVASATPVGNQENGKPSENGSNGDQQVQAFVTPCAQPFGFGTPFGSPFVAWNPSFFPGVQQPFAGNPVGGLQREVG